MSNVLLNSQVGYKPIQGIQSGDKKINSSDNKTNIKQKKDDKFPYSYLAATGLAVLAGVLIYKGRNSGNGEKTLKKAQDAIQQNKPTQPEPPAIVSDFEKGVKKFFNSDNNAVENVTVKKGFATNADGTAFTGTMKTLNKQNNELTINYENGWIKQIKNGDKHIGFREYIGKNQKPVDRSKAVIIKGLNREPTLIAYHDNGKIAKRIFPSKDKTGKSITKIVEYSPEGKKIAEFESLGETCSADIPAHGKVYFEDGKTVEREIFKNENGVIIENIYSKEGQLLKTKYKVNYRHVDMLTTQFANTQTRASGIDIYNPDGKSINKTILASVSDGGVRLDLYYPSSENQACIEVPIFSDLIQPAFNKQMQTKMRYSNEIGDFILRIENSGVKTIFQKIWNDEKQHFEQLPVKKEEILKLADEFESMVKIAEEGNLDIKPVKMISTGYMFNQSGQKIGGISYPIERSYERTMKYVKLLREYAEKMV